MTQKLTTEISIGSLVRRIGKEETDKLGVFFKEYECELRRIGRSRNWKVIGAYDDILIASIDLGFMVNEGKSVLASVHSSLHRELLKTDALDSVVKFRINDFTANLSKDSRNQLRQITDKKRIRIKKASAARHADLIGTAHDLAAVCGEIHGIYPPNHELKSLSDKLGALLNKYGIEPSKGETKNTLAKIIESDPSITAQQLCILTNCTLKDARSALDDWEFG